MSATKKSAPAAPVASALDIAQSVASEQISKAARKYVDVDGVPRVATVEGTLATVQREVRADDSLGEYMLCEVRVNQRDHTESVQRYSIARVQALKDALSAASVTILR